MTTLPNARPMPDPPRKGSTLVLALLGLCWLATPVLLYGAAIIGASFFGEAPSEEDVQTSTRLLVGGLATGFAAPLLGAVLSAVWRRRMGIWVFGGAFALTAAAAVWLVLATSS